MTTYPEGRLRGPCYGIDLSGDTCRVVRADRSGSACREITPGQTDAWREFLADAAKTNTALAAALPVTESLTLWLAAPLSSVRKAEKVLPSLLDIQLPFPLERCQHVFLALQRRADKQVHALALAARLEDIERRLTLFRDRQLDPDRLDHEGLALWTRSVEELPPQKDRLRIVAALYPDRVALALGRGPDFLNAHGLRLASAAELTQLPDRLRRILAAEVQPGTELDWIFCGPEAEDAVLLSALQTQLRTAWPGTFRTVEEPRLFLARSLAGRALRPTPWSCNLRTGALAHPKALLRSDRRLRHKTLLLLLTGLLLCGLNMGWTVAVRRGLAATTAAVTALARELAPQTAIPYGQELYTVQKTLDQEKAPLQPFLRAVSPSLLPALGALVDTARGNGVSLETLTLESQTIALSGSASGAEACGKLEQWLKTRGYSTKVDQHKVAGNRIAFSIHGERKE